MNSNIRSGIASYVMFFFIPFSYSQDIHTWILQRFFMLLAPFELIL
jgi:hypothetical protein